LNLGLGSNAIWHRFWRALGDPEYAARPEFQTNADRRKKRAEIVGEIQRRLLSKKRAEWLKIFAAARIPAGPINRVDQVSHDKALQERGLFYVLQEGSRALPQIGLGIQINGASSVPRAAPPLLGQHTDEVLSALGEQ
jgi:crotonobetainyl-CoA:carnitine CoA-transferase CaiB-like acyl-CoA transferase